MKSDKLLTLKNVIIAILSFVSGVAVNIFITKEWNIPTGNSVTIIVATAAFFSSYYHFHAIRKHQRLSVKPKFQISNRFDSTDKEDYYTFRVNLDNVGLGPGEVISKTMTLGGIATTNVHDEFEEWIKLVNKILPSGCNPECHSARCDTGFSLNNNKSIDLLLVRFSKTSMSFLDAREMIRYLNKEIKINIHYTSMYGMPFECKNHLTSALNGTKTVG